MLRTEILVLVIASYAVLLFAYSWPEDFRSRSPVFVGAAWAAFMVRTFSFHLGIMLVAVAVAAAFLRMRWAFIAVLPLLAVTVGPTCRQYLPQSAPTVAGRTLTVMNVNLLMINRTTEPIIEEIKAADPDVILFQEYAPHWHRTLQAGLGFAYPHIVEVTQEDSFGAAVYSRIRFAEAPEAHLRVGSALEPQIRAVIEIGGRPIALYNIYLLPPWGLDYTIETRLMFADLVNLLTGESLPIVLGGDFNFTDSSAQAAALRGLGLNDVHTLAGAGRGTTWPVNGFFRWIPGLRVDHIYLNGPLNCTETRTGIGTGSDHRPIIATIGFRE